MYCQVEINSHPKFFSEQSYCDAVSKNYGPLIFKNGMVVSNLELPKVILTREEFIAYRIHNLQCDKFSDYDTIETLCLLLGNVQLHSNEVRKLYNSVDLRFLFTLLKNVKVCELDNKIKNGIFNLGYSQDGDNFILRGYLI